MAEEKKSKVFYHSVEVDEKSAAYFLQELKLEQLENQLLGELQPDGKYVISEDILKILVSLYKKIKKQDQTRMELEAKCGKVTFNFFVDLGTIGRDSRFATLKFVENFSLFADDEVEDLVTPVLYYKDDNDIYFMSKIKKLFNIISDDESEGKDKLNETLAKVILDKKSKMKMAFERYLQISRNKDKVYVKKMLLLLENSGDFGKFILRRYKALSQDFSKILDPKSNGYYRNLKRILDKLILNEKNRPKDFDEMIGKLRTSYVAMNARIFEISVNLPKKVKEDVIKLGKGPGAVKFGNSKGGGASKAKSATTALPPMPFSSSNAEATDISALSEDAISNYMKQSLEKIYESINKNAVENDLGMTSVVENSGVNVSKDNEVDKEIKNLKENVQEL